MLRHGLSRFVEKWMTTLHKYSHSETLHWDRKGGILFSQATREVVKKRSTSPVRAGPGDTHVMVSIDRLTTGMWPSRFSHKPYDGPGIFTR